MGKRGGKKAREDQLNTDLPESDGIRKDSTEADLFAGLQNDFETLLSNSAKQQHPDMSLDELDTQIHAAAHSDNGQNNLQSVQPDAEQQHKLRPNKEASTDASEADKTDACFAPFSEADNDASQHPDSLHSPVEEDLFIHVGAPAASSDKIPADQSHAGSADPKGPFAGKSAYATAERKPMIHPLSQPTGEHGNRRMIAAIVIAVALSVSGAILYRLGTQSDQRSTQAGDEPGPATDTADVGSQPIKSKTLTTAVPSHRKNVAAEKKPAATSATVAGKIRPDARTTSAKKRLPNRHAAIQQHIVIEYGTLGD